MVSKNPRNFESKSPILRQKKPNLIIQVVTPKIPRISSKPIFRPVNNKQEQRNHLFDFKERQLFQEHAYCENK
jgi:hypothetical protein